MKKTARETSPTIPPTPVPVGYVFCDELVIPAGRGKAISLSRGHILQLIDVQGHQVADVMAWRLTKPDEYLSPAHTISCLNRLVPREGDELFSNHRRPLLRIRRDTVGQHDLIVPCCDPERYERDFGLSDHRSCLANIQEALTECGASWTPRAELAWNVFMNNVVEPDGSIRVAEPPHGPGSFIELEALDDLGVVASSCPQDLTPCNAWVITEMAFRIFRPAP